MKDKPIVWYTKLRADIFCKDFCEQLHLENIKLPPDDPSFYYDLGIIVNSINVYNVDKIRQYLFDHGSYRSLGDLYEEFDDILRQQFKPVYEAFKAFGYRFGSAFICALGSGDCIYRRRRATCTEKLSQAGGEIEPPRRSREPAVGPHHAVGKHHCCESSIRGKALPAEAAGRARDQSS